MKKILTVFGTRPEAIKMAPLVKALDACPDLDHRVCVTAQHREMLDQVLALFEITPQYDLNVMKANQSLYDVTANVLLGMKPVLEDFQPDVVLVHGDTTTTFSAALAAFYQKIAVGHVEAGLRTGNIYSPWPEEANRQLTTQIATYNFAPTETSKANLLREMVDESSIVVTGNTVIDALLMVVNKIKSDAALEGYICDKITTLGYEIVPNSVCSSQSAVCSEKSGNSNLRNGAITQLRTGENRRLVLVTGHRRENFGQGFLNICEGLKELAQNNPDIDVVYPVHLNPNVRQPVNEILAEVSNVHLIEPLDYEPFVYLMDRSYMIITDSGGVQEEAPSLGKPVLVMRDTTERPEAVEAGTVKLVGADKATIIAEAQKLLDDQDAYEVMSRAHNPYGDGTACQRIAEFLVTH